MQRLIVLDTETTGIEIEKGNRIIEIGAVEIINRSITKSKYHQYVYSDKNVGDSIKVHGISDKFLKNKPKFTEIAHNFLDYIQDSTLVIHNAPFDLGFLNNELKLIGIQEKIEDKCEIIDTLELSKKQRPGMMHSLDALCRRFEVDASARTVHGALLDAKILAEVYLAMTGGQYSLFNENTSATTKTNNKEIIRVDNNRDKINIIYASEEELQEHKKYFTK